MNRNYLIISAALLMLAGCTSDELAERDSGLVPVRLTASQADIALSGATTRAADGLYNESSGWDGGERIKVYMNSTSTSSDYTVNSSDRQTLDGGTLTYPTTGDVTLFAIYPSTSVLSHTVKYDQTTSATYKASDLMFASVDVTQANKATTQNLQFEHQLAKLKVNIIKASDVAKVTQVKMKNVLRTVALSPSTSSIGLGTINGTPSGNADYNATDNNAILIFSGENTSTAKQTFCCVFPANQQWSGTDFIEVTADGKTATYKLTRSSFTAGSEYELTLNINAATLGTSASITGWTDTQAVTVEGTTIIQDANEIPLTLETIAGASTITLRTASIDEEGYWEVNDRSSFPIIRYKINDGAIQTIEQAYWTKVSYDYQYSFTLPANSTVSFYGNITTFALGPNHTVRIDCSNDCYVYGNILSLYNANEYKTMTTLPEKFCAYYLFAFNTHIYNHPTIPITLPATTLQYYCYMHMFNGCTGLTRAPELPATTLTAGCYYNMFRDCTNLSYVKMLATNISANDCLEGWLSNTSSAGLFIKHASASWSTTGVNGIPTGWSVVTASN